MDDPDRRRLIKTAANLAILAVPFGARLRAASPGRRLPDAQPLLAQVRRVAGALAYLGEPLADAAALDAIDASSDATTVVSQVERLLAPRCLLDVRINPE